MRPSLSSRLPDASNPVTDSLTRLGKEQLMKFPNLLWLAVISLVSCASKPPADQAAAPVAEEVVQASADGRVEIAVMQNGFVPNIVAVKAGQPVTLVVTRKTDKTCATDFVLKDQNINQPLPLDSAVTITFTPDKAGDLSYSCAMDMFRGTIRVQ